MKSTSKTNFPMKNAIGFMVMFASLMTGCVTQLDGGYSHGHIAAQNVEFMLSFDDGPLPDKTERVLDSLAKLRVSDGTQVKAGFFLVADGPDEFWRQQIYYAPYELWIEKGSIVKYPKIARQIQQAGHVIGSHSTHHNWFQWPWLDTSEAMQGDFAEWEAISEPVLGSSNMRLFRPPYLVLSSTVRETAQRLGYQVVMGESVGDTIPGMTVAEIKQKTLSILAAWNKPYPCILIFHDNRPATYQHLDEIVSNLQSQGFKLVNFDPKRI